MKNVLVFVPVAGKATRAYPLSLEIPKHQFPINGKPLEKYIIEKSLGLPIDEYDVSVYKNAGDPPKGTAWSLLKIPNITSYDHVVVWYGDIYSEVDLRSMLLFHENMYSNLTILCREAMNETKKGLFDLEYQRIVDFKKGNHYNGWNPIRKLGNTFKNPYRDVGILIIDKKGIEYIIESSPKIFNDSQEYDLSTHVFPHMVKNMNCYGYISDSYTQDVGTLDTYLEVICHTRKLDFKQIKEEMNK